ncbi:MAG: hypothetical protein JWN15_1120 [Firmicutes bacterium]|nr:hypothetical protein [Bacillota bacterium]
MLRKLVALLLVGIQAPLVLVVSGLLFATQAFAANPAWFANLTETNGVAATSSRLFVTPYCRPDGQRPLYTVNSAGVSSLFAWLQPRPAGCYEEYLAVSPGLGGFTANEIYVLQGTHVVKVTADGSSVTTFTTIPSLSPTHSGITFDQVGTWSHDMIVTSQSGEVWRITSAGVATMVKQLPAGVMIEGPAVAPNSFAPYGGWVLVGSENTSRVYAISPSGTVAIAADWPSAESIHVIPDNACSFGTSGGSFFSANYPYGLVRFPTTDFAGLGGKVMVTSENGGGVGLMSANGTSVAISSFDAEPYHYEGSAFVDCAVPPCTIDPSVGWKTPLSADTPATVPNGTNVPVRFVYGDCSHGFIHDESVVIAVNKVGDPNDMVTIWVYGSDITIDDATHEYAVNFNSGLYGLPAGSALEVSIYMSGVLRGTAGLNLN